MLFPQVVTASNAHSETWLDEEYQLSPKVRDVRDHGESCYCWLYLCCISDQLHRHPGVGGQRPPGWTASALVSATHTLYAFQTSTKLQACGKRS